MVRALLALALALGLTVQVQAASQHPTFVLVHGALFTSAGWMKAQSALQTDGYNVATVDVPGRAGDGIAHSQIDIGTAAEKVCQVASLQNGPVILVGHSQGGAVITQALDKCAAQVKALVFVAAVAPLNGEIAFQMLDPNVDTAFMQCVMPDPKAHVFRLNRQGPLYASFFQDLPLDEADAVTASMVDEPMGIGSTPLSFPQAAYDATPKFYVEALKDRVLTPGTQKKIQARVQWQKVFSMDTGHSPFLSRPTEFVQVLKDIASSL
jgi:pimeloyl-ACP methyl ester carboxylesterase